jgi:hypothetical protein
MSVEGYVDFPAVMATIARRFPEAFGPRGDPPRLLADDALGQLITGLADQFEQHEVERFFSWWTSRPNYLAALRIGGKVYDTLGHCGWVGRQ